METKRFEVYVDGRLAETRLTPHFAIKTARTFEKAHHVWVIDNKTKKTVYFHGGK